MEWFQSLSPNSTFRCSKVLSRASANFPQMHKNPSCFPAPALQNLGIFHGAEHSPILFAPPFLFWLRCFSRKSKLWSIILAKNHNYSKLWWLIIFAKKAKFSNSLSPPQPGRVTVRRGPKTSLAPLRGSVPSLKRSGGSWYRVLFVRKILSKGLP